MTVLKAQWQQLFRHHPRGHAVYKPTLNTFSLYVFLWGLVVVKSRTPESGLSRRDDENERGKKIWFLNNALVCISLFELLLDIKMFKSADCSISHWFRVNLPALSCLKANLKGTSTAIISQRLKLLVAFVQRPTATKCRLWRGNSPHLCWLDSLRSYDCSISSYTRRWCDTIPNAANWHSPRGSSSPVLAAEPLDDHVPIRCTLYFPVLWDRCVFSPRDGFEKCCSLFWSDVIELMGLSGPLFVLSHV